MSCVELGFFTCASENQQLVYPIVCAGMAFLGLTCVRGILYLLSKADEIKQTDHLKSK